MNAGFRFLYLNFYAGLLLLSGAVAAAVPLYRITALFLFIQIPAALFCLYQSARILIRSGDTGNFSNAIGKNGKNIRSVRI